MAKEKYTVAGERTAGRKRDVGKGAVTFRRTAGKRKRAAAGRENTAGKRALSGKRTAAGRHAGSPEMEDPPSAETGTESASGAKYDAGAKTTGKENAGIYTPQEIFIPTLEALEAEKKRLKSRKRYQRVLRNTLYTLVIVAAVSVLAATLFLPILQVSGSSMEPTLEDEDIVVLFSRSSFENGDLVGFYYQNRLLLKRVIAGPGDVIDIDDAGNVRVNDVLLDEPYVTNKAMGETDRTYPYQVPDGRYFVMGDNRLSSIDSRSTTIGCIERDQIVGKVILRIWPLGSLSFIR